MKPRAWLIGALVAGLTAGLAIGQQIAQLNLTGNEVVLAQLGPGGGGIFTTTAALRNATGYQLQGAGTTINTSPTNLVAKLIATGAITTWNISPPANPYDGEMFEVACPGGTASTVVVSPNTLPGMVGAAFTSCSSGGAAANTAEWTYSTSANTWYRIQ